MNSSIAKSYRLILFLAVMSTAGTTVAINPFFAFDPINLIKSSFLSVFTLGLFFSMWNLNVSVLKNNKLIMALIALIFIGAVLTFMIHVRNHDGWQRMFWGTWGRSTGLLTWLMLLALTVSFASLIRGEFIKLQSLWNVLLRTSYVVSAYALIQIAKLDPITWSNDLAVSTLGNINFLSAFLGLVSVYIVGKVFEKNLSNYTRVYFVILCLIYCWLMSYTGSIQGIAMTATGLSIIILLKMWEKLGILKASIFWASISMIGVVILLGTIGIGPLGGSLVQQSVLFRLDYWSAAVNMLRSHLLIGVGFDNYGDYYREFRFIDAVERTGPQRVSDTAHNIFLDLFTGGGIVTGLPFLALIVYVLYKTFHIARQSKSHDLYILVALISSWFIFMLISINQIGVAVWGFCFLGVAIAFMVADKNSISHKQKLAFKSNRHRLKNLKSEEKQNIPRPSISNHRGILRQFRIILGLVIGFLLTFPPNWTDSQFKIGLKKGDAMLMEKSAFDLGGTDVHLKTLIGILEGQGDFKGALRVAQMGTKKFPRDFASWVSVALNPEATKEERLKSARVLIALDPYNLYLREDLLRRIQG